ncbi:hypothetical protein ACFVYD_35345 [Streptomyces sp. NPDC058301]|uniref:hypothetical protein n=1 Tax=Streptomyces sp. NPDC058301 TaxID=3346436 RepID=UPI0036E1A64A
MPEQPSLTTRQLMAGVHLDRRYRNAVIDELYEHEERYSAPSYDVDAAAVLAEALTARRTALRWAVPMALLWIAGFLLAGWLYALYAAGFTALAGAAALRRARHPVVRVTAGILWVLGGVVLGASFAAAAVTPWPDGWSGVTAAVAGPALMAAVAEAHRAAVEKRLRFIGSSTYRRSEQPRRFGMISALIEAERTSSMAVDPAPLLGAGTLLAHSAQATEVLGHTAVFEVSDVLARVRSRVGAVPGLTARVDECFLLPEEGAPRRWSLPHPRPDELPASTRWLRITSGDPGSRLTTVFVQIRLDGPVLFVQQATCALPPVRREFRAANRARFPLGRTLAAPAALPAELATWAVRRARRLPSSPPGSRPPSGPHLSIRELASEPTLPPLTAAEAERISWTVRLLVLDAVREVLRDQGLSAPGLNEQRTESHNAQNSGIHIGNITPGTIAAGFDARASDITRHTSPGPTTNPDDDSWEDDLG